MDVVFVERARRIKTQCKIKLLPLEVLFYFPKLLLSRRNRHGLHFCRLSCHPHQFFLLSPTLFLSFFPHFPLFPNRLPNRQKKTDIDPQFDTSFSRRQPCLLCYFSFFLKSIPPPPAQGVTSGGKFLRLSWFWIVLVYLGWIKKKIEKKYV